MTVLLIGGITVYELWMLIGDITVETVSPISIIRNVDFNFFVVVVKPHN